MRYLHAICLGVPFGLFAGLCAFLSGDSASRTPARVFDFIDTPVGLITGWLYPVSNRNMAANVRSMKCFMLLHFGYWALLGALVFYGVAALRSKMTDDE